MTEASLENPRVQVESDKRFGAKLNGYRRADLRRLLLLGVPAAALVVGLGLYLSGGRYVSTDNAYVGTHKVLITPDISGKVVRTLVREGQRVAAGDALFEIDPAPLQNSLRQAQGRLDSVRTDFANLKNNHSSFSRLLDLGRQSVDIKRRELERRTALAEKRAGSQSDLDAARAALLNAELQVELLRQQVTSTSNQLQGDPDLPIEDFPAYRQAKAALDQARRDLDHAVVRAPISGTATQVDNIQLGRFVAAGTPLFSVVDHEAPWIDANPKETDVTHLRAGQRVDIRVDAFPDRRFQGRVDSIGPGTGAQFAILPPQNASGNWVKVVQRVPLRVVFDASQDVSMLRAGMSANVEIDTGRQSKLTSLFGTNQSRAAETRP